MAVPRVRKSMFVILLFSAVVLAQQSGAEKQSTVEAIEPVSGKQLYSSHCAPCHGPDGKGGGPLATQLKVWPPDLTQLAKKNKGVFPSMRIAAVIDGEFDKAAHGSREMPIWGPVFRSMAHGHSDSAQLRINRVVKYLESLQQK